MAETDVAAAVLSRHDNASVWFNFTTWTVQHMPYLNMTKLAPSIEDLVLAGPRMVMKLGRLGSVFSFPDAVDGFGQRHMPDATADPTVVFAATTDAVAAAARSFITTAAPPPAAAPSLAAAQDGAAASRFSFESARSFGSVFSYATSKWALCCMAMAVVLNRTHIFAATRRRLRFRWPVRLALRIVPIVLFTFQAQSLVRSIQCQTSPDFAELRWGNASKSSDLMFSHANSFLHGLSSGLLLGPSDAESCLAVNMIPPPSPAAGGAEGTEREQAPPDLRGSLSLLWPLFGSFCLSQFLETISCAVQGRPLAAETGMTLFEHSLAFAEAESAISNQLGWGLFTASSASTAAGAAKAAASVGSSSSAGATIAITRSMIMRRANTPPEVLLVALLSTMGHFTSHVLGVFNLQSRFRLVSTGFYAACFMGSIIWSGFTFSLDDPARQGLLRFPTVCIIGYIPHLLVLFGMLTCCSIYSLALVLSALSPPEVGPSPDHEGEDLSTLGARIRRAHDNMQANISLSDIRVTMEMDFYTALLRAGFAAISMASEAVYLNEDRRVNLKRYTWLEDERLREIEQLRMQWMPNSRYDSNGVIGLVPIVQTQTGSPEGAGGYATSGYARERAAQKVSKGHGNERVRPLRDGVGAHERSGRWLLALEYLMHINRLMLRVLAMAACKTLARLGVANPPRFLRRMAQEPKPRDAPDDTADVGAMDATDPTVDGGAKVDGVRDGRGRIVGEWMRGQDAGAYVPWKSGVDLEEIVTKGFPEEKDTSGVLYDWWLHGGWWGEVDKSGDYRPPSDHDDPDFDATSVVSTTETDPRSDVGRWDSEDNEQGWEEEEDDDDDDGQRTPTRRSPFATRESTPMVDSPMAMADLARLLHPQSPEERDEALALAAHLGSDGIMTRSRFARLSAQQRTRVLLPAGASSALDLVGRARHQQPRRSHKMSPDEEAQLLEQILLSRRAQAAGEGSASASSWATGAAGMGPEGPQCVVCHSAPRTIIVWPCRCLSLCDDCRVSLAMNNFDKCVCCRREVISFSRIFVP